MKVSRADEESILMSLLSIANVTMPLADPAIVLVASVSCLTVTKPIFFKPSSTSKLDDEVNTGAVVSTTFTVLVAVPAFPEASVDV